MGAVEGLELAPIVPGRKMTGANMNDFDRIAVYFQYKMQSNKGTYAKYGSAAVGAAALSAAVLAENTTWVAPGFDKIVWKGTADGIYTWIWSTCGIASVVGIFL